MYKIVISGKSKVVSLCEISRKLKPSSEIYDLSDKEIYLGVISHQTLVLFATEFAHYALQNYAKKIIPEAETCIDLTRKWLEDQSSVSKEGLMAAAAAAYAAHDAADAYAAYAAAAAYAAHDAADAYAAHDAAAAAYAYAACATYAADAADAAAHAAAANAADAAAYAAYAAYAADAAADAAGENKDQEYERQGTFILGFLKAGKHLFLV